MYISSTGIDSNICVCGIYEHTPPKDDADPSSKTNSSTHHILFTTRIQTNASRDCFGVSGSQQALRISLHWTAFLVNMRSMVAVERDLLEIQRCLHQASIGTHHFCENTTTCMIFCVGRYCNRCWPIRYFHLHAWDPSDIADSCHHGGVFAWQDPYGLAYCVEGRLERALLRIPQVYKRWDVVW